MAEGWVQHVEWNEQLGGEFAIDEKRGIVYFPSGLTDL